ncbi:DUF222 domain-containing protein [Salinibacterium sp. dk2585]|uniref:HNH endonuclease signature motif containing protein n=1 Tax=unclassified Salinibacterium TaxID=2632331 RepID=UPI0011C251A8|nr:MULTISPECIES: HNH endonuclease signature motif containing protein [unclassified Salinibacterium]QEE62024.1 DUF222 domain-containing protein [Salinibacterium sp. dk2585]TXK54421.1 DUF222 domain-containing protein [Salinibacterium sp. dk5596]
MSSLTLTDAASTLPSEARGAREAGIAVSLRYSNVPSRHVLLSGAPSDRPLGADVQSDRVSSPDVSLGQVSVSGSLATFESATDALRLMPDSLDLFDALSDDELLAVQRELSAQRRLIESRSALVAAQISRRSARELGSDGLAQRGGYRTAEELIRVTTGSTANEARQAVRVGLTIDEAQRGGRVDMRSGELTAPSRPWLTAVSAAVASGDLSLASADSIANGLGAPNDDITADMLADAAARLLLEATRGSDDAIFTPLDADRLYRRARDLRDELDLAGVASREEARRAARALRIYQRVDGMTRLVWDMDPETAAVVRESYDQLTSPRRGGPRFVEGTPENDRAERILSDGRTTEQLASDGFLELLRIAADTAPTTLIGTRRPSVRVLGAAPVLEKRRGSGAIEGQADPVSIDTVERLACAQGVQAIVMDADGQPLDVGREQRLYTRRQRIALAARDGGCRWPRCERPPAWTEAHHIKHWFRDGGATNVADGILLCRHHHLLLHNNHWEITRTGGDYWLTPPPSVDPEQQPIRMPSRSPTPRDLQGTGMH